MELTTLFADVSGSTKLFEQRGDVEARRIIADVLNALAEVCRLNGGRVIKTIGDEVLCTFPSAQQGVLASIEMQNRIMGAARFARDRIGIRIGLHHGSALIEEGDVFGDSVNVAARMAALSKREQIITTAATVGAMAAAADIRSRSLGFIRVNGKAAPIEVVDILWQQNDFDVTTVQRIDRIDDGGTTNVRLRLLFHDRTIDLTENSPPFSIGRDASNTLVVETEWVSRNHALIEFKKGYFVIADRSTNGTYVRLGDVDELRVHRDEIHLRKSGTISLGQAVDVDRPDVLRFQCSY